MIVDHKFGPLWNGYNWRCICGFHTFSDIEARTHAFLADDVRARIARAEWLHTNEHPPKQVNLHNQERGAA